MEKAPRSSGGPSCVVQTAIQAFAHQHHAGIREGRGMTEAPAVAGASTG